MTVRQKNKTFIIKRPGKADYRLVVLDYGIGGATCQVEKDMVSNRAVFSCLKENYPDFKIESFDENETMRFDAVPKNLACKKHRAKEMVKIEIPRASIKLILLALSSLHKRLDVEANNALDRARFEKQDLAVAHRKRADSLIGNMQLISQVIQILLKIG